MGNTKAFEAAGREHPGLVGHPRRRWSRGIVALACIIAAMSSIGASPASAASITTTRIAASVRGHVDAITTGAGTIRVSGWAYDPAEPTTPSTLNIVVDGTMAALPWADLPRGNADRAFPVSTAHGFDTTVFTSAGEHRVCVHARAVADSGSRNAVLGCWLVGVTGDLSLLVHRSASARLSA